jgi:hypothetical protein
MSVVVTVVVCRRTFVIVTLRRRFIALYGAEYLNLLIFDLQRCLLADTIGCRSDGHGSGTAYIKGPDRERLTAVTF